MVCQGKGAPCNFVKDIPSSKSSSQLSVCSSGGWRTKGNGCIFSTSPSGALMTEPFTFEVELVFHPELADEED
jgi:hypothetical protein